MKIDAKNMFNDTTKARSPANPWVYFYSKNPLD